jgi:hypothetical protein
MGLSRDEGIRQFDVVIVGAGFAGLYMQVNDKLAEYVRGEDPRALARPEIAEELSPRGTRAVDRARARRALARRAARDGAALRCRGYEWVAHSDEVAPGSLFPTAKSWYMGDNIPGSHAACWYTSAASRRTVIAPRGQQRTAIRNFVSKGSTNEAAARTRRK